MKISVFVLLAVALLYTTPAIAQSPPAKSSWMDYKEPYVGEEHNLANPHRSSDEIATWAQQAAADVLTFTPADYKDKLNGFKKYFALPGWKLYAAYLKNTKFIDMIANDGFTATAIIDSVPEIINQGAGGGAYHWIVRMPVTISFFHADAGDNPVPAVSGKYILLMDVVRTAGEEIAITNWRMDDAPPPPEAKNPKK